MTAKRIADSFCSAVDTVSKWAAWLGGVLLVAMAGLVCMDSTLRYVFHRPTTWAFDLDVVLLAVIVVLAGAYGQLHKAHVSVEFVPEKLPETQRIFLGIFTYTMFFFTIGLLTWLMWKNAWSSTQLREISSTYWKYPVYPLKIAVFIGFLLLWLEGLATFLRDIVAKLVPSWRQP